MNYNSSDYFAYKRDKLKRDIKPPSRPISKFNFLLQLFIATFIIMFILIVFLIIKFSSKIDVDFSKDAATVPYNMGDAPKSYLEDDGIQLKIDKRLTLIQQEENAPNEARIIVSEKNNTEVMNPDLIEDIKKIEKEEKVDLKKQDSLIRLFDEKESQNSETSKSKKSNEKENRNFNITIMSKVLSGRFSTFEEAQKHQMEVKNKDSALTPYVKKVGDVYTVQLGSYQDFDTAKKHAHQLKSKGIDVWIYQQ